MTVLEQVPDTAAPVEERELDLGRVGIWTNQLNSLKGPELKDTLQELDGLGFGAIWQGESATGREALTGSALALSWTDRIVVATGIASIWGRDAAGLASAQRMLCETFPYRFLLGIGVSHEDQIAARGHEFDDKPLTAMRHYLRGMDVQPAGVLPHPPVPPPRVLGALGARMLDLARDHAQGAHTFLVTPEHTRIARDTLGPGRILAPELGVLLEEDATTAREVLRGELAARLTYENYRKSLEHQGYVEADFLGGGSDELVDRLFAWGSISDIAERVDEHIAAGADHVALYALRPSNAPVPLEEWRELAALI